MRRSRRRLVAELTIDVTLERGDCLCKASAQLDGARHVSSCPWLVVHDTITLFALLHDDIDGDQFWTAVLWRRPAPQGGSWLRG